MNEKPVYPGLVMQIRPCRYTTVLYLKPADSMYLPSLTCVTLAHPGHVTGCVSSNIKSVQRFCLKYNKFYVMVINGTVLLAHL